MNAPPVQYVTTSDGYNIAYTVSGEGRPLVFLPLGINHVQLSWRHDTRISAWLEGLAARFRLIRYDGRGQGLSTRGLTSSHSMADMERDLETVIEHLKLDHFVVLAYFYPGHVAVRYAARHPECVDALVLIACAISMNAWPLDSLVGLAEQNWEGMLHNWVPSNWAPEARERLLDYFKQTGTQADWVHTHQAFSRSNIEDVVEHVTAPTLLLHPRDYLWLDSNDAAKLAARIVNSRFTLIDGFLPLGDAEEGIKAIEEFLREIPSRENPVVPILSDPQVPRASGLSVRQAEVLRMIAEGKTNREIAEALVLSERTVERHVADVYAKLDVRNRAEAVGFARDHPSGA